MMRANLAPLVAALALVADMAAAHSFEVTYADVRFLSADAIRVDVTFHFDAMLAGIPFGELGESDYRQLRALPRAEIERRLEMVRRYFETMIALRFDRQAVDTSVSFPARDACSSDGSVPLPGHLVRLEGRVPRGARTFAFSGAPVFNQITLRIHGATAGPVVQQIFSPLEESRPYALHAGAADSSGWTLAIAAVFVVAGWLRARTTQRVRR
jgi:hypothetical protein